MSITIKRADYTNPAHAQDIIEMLNIYALDPMGGGQALGSHTKENLVSELSKRPYAFSILAYQQSMPVGLVNCFEGFSTFKAKPLINIHDLVVDSSIRGQGVSQKLLQEIENIACERGACKITLEVLSGNKAAQNAYIKFGFKGYELSPEKGHALFWEKSL